MRKNTMVLLEQLTVIRNSQQEKKCFLRFLQLNAKILNIVQDLHRSLYAFHLPQIISTV